MIFRHDTMVSGHFVTSRAGVIGGKVKNNPHISPIPHLRAVGLGVG